MISIVMPSYNSEKTIGRCIDSILNQTFTDFELIVVDDGSNDRTAEIVEGKMSADKRIHLIKQPNCGVSAARNRGIDRSIGSLICFADSDDAVSPDYLKELHSLYAPGVLPIADIIRSDGNGSALIPIGTDYILTDGWADSYFCGKLRYGIAFSVCNKLFSREIIEENNIRFENKMSVGEDMLFVFEYLCRCRRVRFSNKACYYYQIADGSAMASAKDYLKAYEKTFQIISKKAVSLARIGEDTLPHWAFDTTVFIITNPFITNKNYAAFSLWWETFRQTALYRAAMKFQGACGLKQRILHRAIHFKNPTAVYKLLKIYAKMRRKSH